MQMNLDDWIDHHDALIEGLHIDPSRRQVTVRLLSYPGLSAPQRVPATITFTEVDLVSATVDLMVLADNAFAGHVNQARLADGPGTSHFYLTEGYLAVTSRRPPHHTPIPAHRA
jgi:hypothetical protein